MQTGVTKITSETKEVVKDDKVPCSHRQLRVRLVDASEIRGFTVGGW